MYRSPNCSAIEKKDKLNNMISTLYDSAGLESCILVDDFNHPEIDWTNESCACHTDHPQLLSFWKY